MYSLYKKHRSFVGANSGTITQRQTVMYEDREDTTINYRVHPTPGIFLYSNFKVSYIEFIDMY